VIDVRTCSFMMFAVVVGFYFICFMSFVAFLHCCVLVQQRSVFSSLGFVFVRHPFFDQTNDIFLFIHDLILVGDTSS
jgi:hypothetical protein